MVKRAFLDSKAKRGEPKPTSRIRSTLTLNKPHLTYSRLENGDLKMNLTDAMSKTSVIIKSEEALNLARWILS